jgi:hypothetical protein
MAFAALHLLLALIVLGAQYDAAYRSLDRREPNEDAARTLHIGVIVTGAALLGAGAFLSRHVSPWVGAAALPGIPLGLALFQMSRTYSHTDCWNGFWWSGCTSEGAALPAIHAVFGWLAFGALLAALVCRLGIGPRASAAALLGCGLAVASAFTVASINLLLNLGEEAAKAAEANEPIIHDTPGLGPVLVGLGLVAAVAFRRRA